MENMPPTSAPSSVQSKQWHKDPSPTPFLEACLSLGLTAALNSRLETQLFCEGRAGRTGERKREDKKWLKKEKHVNEVQENTQAETEMIQKKLVLRDH